MLRLPSRTPDPTGLTDWLEMNSLVGKAGQASLDDLRRALKASSWFAHGGSSEQRTIQVEDVVAQVGREVKVRSELTRNAYPFRVRGSSLERRRMGDSCCVLPTPSV